MTVLKIVRLFIKHKPIERSQHKLFSSALVAMLAKTDDGILISKVFKLLMTSKVKAEPVLVSLWRKKAVEEKGADKTKKVFWVYQIQPAKVKNVDQIVHFLFRKTFKGVLKNQRLDLGDVQINSDVYLNFLLETSLSADLAILDQLVNVFTALTAEKNSGFQEFSGKSWLIHWLVALIFRLSGQREDHELFQRSLALLSAYCLSRYKLNGQIDWLNTISELISYYTLESNNEKLKFEIVNSIFEELNKDGVIFENKNLVSSFLVFCFKLYFANLAESFADDQFVTFTKQFWALAHRTVNLNPLPSLPLDLTEDISTVFGVNNRLMTSLINSTAFLTGTSDASKDGYVCPIKCLVIMASDILDALVNRRETPTKMEDSFEFVNAFVYRINYFLDNNRKKTES